MRIDLPIKGMGMGAGWAFPAGLMAVGVGRFMATHNWIIPKTALTGPFLKDIWTTAGKVGALGVGVGIVAAIVPPALSEGYDRVVASSVTGVVAGFVINSVLIPKLSGGLPALPSGRGTLAAIVGGALLGHWIGKQLHS